MIAKHNTEKNFAPENGEELKFKVGDSVIFTNDNGIEFKLKVTGFYNPAEIDSFYARGYRYIVNSDSPWFPCKEESLRLDTNRNNGTENQK